MEAKVKKELTPQREAAVREIARKIRVGAIRMLAEAESGHPGGSLSAADILAVLLFEVMKHDPKNPKLPDRDRFIMSKGHCIPAWYAALALAGYYDMEETLSLRKLGSRFQGHPDSNLMDPIEACTGSLGQGLSIGVGMAMAAAMNGDSWRVYVMLGDGESQEGQVWEAAMSAAKYKLGSLCGILDYNKAQIDGFVENVMPIEPVMDKWRAFGWNVIRIDGHDLHAIYRAFLRAKTVPDKPTLILADTIKGKGVSFMENQVDWHGKAPSKDEAKRAIEELERN
jgi:transketolase